MALSMGVSVGSKIIIGNGVADERMMRILDTTNGIVNLQMDDGKKFIITDFERTEILPNVFVSLGMKKGETSNTRLAFEAPREIQITRVRESVNA